MNKNLWERRSPHIKVTNEQLTELISPFFQNAVVISHQTLSSGLANTNVKIIIAGRSEPLLLRFYTRDPQALGKEVALYNFLKNQIPAPEILFHSNNPSLGPYAVMKWIDGRLLSDVLKTESNDFLRNVTKDVGQTLALIASNRFERAGFLGKDLKIGDNLPDAIDYIKTSLFEGYTGKHLGMDFAKELWQFVSSHSNIYNRDQDGYFLCHGDFNPDNLMIHPAEPRLVGILDWEFAFSGSYLFDIAQFLRGGHAHSVEENFIESYEETSRRQLPANWRHIAKMLDLVNFCGLLDGPEERPHMTHELKHLIKDTMTLKL